MHYRYAKIRRSISERITHDKSKNQLSTERYALNAIHALFRRQAIVDTRPVEQLFVGWLVSTYQSWPRRVQRLRPSIGDAVMDEATTELVKAELEVYQEKELALKQLTEALEADPKFKAFIQAQQEFRKLESEVWKRVEETMLKHNVKSIKTDLVTLTIVERTNFDIDLDLLPKKYIKRVPNTTLIGSEFKLTGNPVKGTTPTKSQYLMKKFKAA